MINDVAETAAIVYWKQSIDDVYRVCYTGQGKALCLFRGGLIGGAIR